MPVALIAQLLAQFGPAGIQLVTHLISLIESKSEVTSAQWATMISGIAASTAESEMAKQLGAAGITGTDPKFLALINLTKPTSS